MAVWARTAITHSGLLLVGKMHGGHSVIVSGTASRMAFAILLHSPGANDIE